jgi:hypothetical protein
LTLPMMRHRLPDVAATSLGLATGAYSSFL